MIIKIHLKHIFPLSFLLLIACESHVNATPQVTKEVINKTIYHPQPYPNINQPENNIAQRKLIDFARKYIGTRYVWGGITPKGFDCSGFIKYVYNNFNISIPRTTAKYTQLFNHSITLKEAKVGDLIIFTGTNLKIRKPGHAGIISEIKPGLVKFIHSSSSKKHFGVTETSYYQSGYPKRYLTVIKMPNPSKKE